MNVQRFAAFAPLYRSIKAFGADKILRRHLGLDASCPLPITISHGVDFGHMGEPFEIDGIEPLYWAYNRDLFDAAKSIKPALVMPHPFLLAAEGRPRVAKAGTLIVGPPPSPNNDQRLLTRLRDEGIHSGTVLVKGRGAWQASIGFWEGNGYEAVNLGDLYTASYEAMVALFDRFELMISGTISSALFFAASLGTRLRLLNGYRYTAYEIAGYGRSLAARSPAAAANVRILADGSAAEQKQLADRLLGAELSFSAEENRARFERALVLASDSVHFPVRYPAPVRAALKTAARLLGRPGIIIEPLQSRLRRVRQHNATVMELDEVAYWLEGLSEKTAKLVDVPFVAGLTEPGYAVEPYA